jgi:excisionase family DNA binding protein
MIDDKRLLIKKREAANLLGVSERTLHELSKSGIVPSVLLGRRGRRYSVKALEEFIDRQLVEFK